MTIAPIKWKNNRLYLLDQTRLPEKEKYIECRTYLDAARAIKKNGGSWSSSRGDNRSHGYRIRGTDDT